MLCQREAVDPDNLYCWVDYACIPQANVVMKSLSISTIALYSSVCRFFVALCPTLQSGAEPTPFVHNIDSYQTRGWVRAQRVVAVMHPADSPDSAYTVPPRAVGAPDGGRSQGDVHV
eukprot:7379823-Prymnesium_polylepis.1